MIENVIKKPLDAIEDATDLALGVAPNRINLGRHGRAIVAGAAIGRFIEPRLTFSGRFTNIGRRSSRISTRCGTIWYRFDRPCSTRLCP